MHMSTYTYVGVDAYWHAQHTYKYLDTNGNVFCCSTVLTKIALVPIQLLLCWCSFSAHFRFFSSCVSKHNWILAAFWSRRKVLPCQVLASSEETFWVLSSHPGNNGSGGNLPLLSTLTRYGCIEPSVLFLSTLLSIHLAVFEFIPLVGMARLSYSVCCSSVKCFEKQAYGIYLTYKQQSEHNIHFSLEKRRWMKWFLI